MLSCVSFGAIRLPPRGIPPLLVPPWVLGFTLLVSPHVEKIVQHLEHYDLGSAASIAASICFTRSGTAPLRAGLQLVVMILVTLQAFYSSIKASLSALLAPTTNIFGLAEASTRARLSPRLLAPSLQVD